MTWVYAGDAGITPTAAILATFTWYVCTSGSDQIAIQRYLATRDARAARNMLGIALVTDVLVGLFLGLVGLALLGYFVANPHLLADRQTVFGDADKLFTRFIVLGLPTGMSGLIVAGLLAAAMSSLSSGISSTCSVITVDLVDRFRKPDRKLTEADHVRLARYVAVGTGIAVIVLSAYVGMVRGNLLEIAYKVVNLLTVPLFGLFFMAMFVPWATNVGTILGSVVGLAVIATINYWEELFGVRGISFLWGMPIGFVVQAAVGMIASLVPIGRKARRVES